MTQPPKVQCEDNRKSEDGQRVRSARTPSPVAGRRGGKSPKMSQRTLRRRSGSHSRRKSTCCETTGQQQQLPSESPKMRRATSFDKQSRNRRRGSGSHSRRMSIRSPSDEPQDTRNHSFQTNQFNRSNSINSSNHRRGSKSPVSKRHPPVTMTGSGSGRRRAKQTSRRSSMCTAGSDLPTSQINVFQTLERGMNTPKPQLVRSDVSETSDRSLEKAILPAEDSSSKEAPATRHTIPGSNKPTEENQKTTKQRSSDPVKLELDGGVQRTGPQGRRFSWWNLPSSRDLGVENDSDFEEDDLPPVVPPSRRKSLMMQEGETPTSKVASSPKHLNNKRSSSNKKKATRTNSLDSMESGFTMSTDGDSTSFQADSNEARLSPTAATQKVSIGGEDLLSPLPTLPKQHSIGTCTTESTSGSVSSSSQRKRSSKDRRTKKTKRKSSEGSKRSTRSIGTNKALSESKEDTAAATTNSTRPSKPSLEDDLYLSMNRSSGDFSANSRSSTKRSTRTSMSIKQQHNNDLNASSSSMSISLGSDDQDLCSIGSDFEGSADFDFDDDEFPPTRPSHENPATMSASHHDESGYIHSGEDSFRVLDDESKRELRCRIKDKTQRSGGGNTSSSQHSSFRQHRKSPLIMTSVEQGIAVTQN